MVTDGSYTCGERGINYRLVESLCCTPASNIALCVNHPIKEGGGGGEGKEQQVRYYRVSTTKREEL